MAIETTADLAATTYATVDDVKAAAEIRRGPVLAAIEALSDDDILGGLTARTIDFDTLDWDGERASDDQALEWPRTDTDYSDDAWPTRLVTALIEQVFADAVAGTLGDDAEADALAIDAAAGNIKREKTGPIETEYFAPTLATDAVTSLERFAPIVQNLLRPLIATPSSSEWGSSTVTRSS